MNLTSTPPSPVVQAETTRPVGHYRWVICGLLFVITTIN
jgi:hypothetical protein